MTETTVGREPIQIVEIVQPLCSRVFGVAPCAAVGTADTKSYNTRATCKDTANFLLGTPLSLYFSSGKFGELRVKKNAADAANLYIIPSLMSVTTAPVKINLAGSDPDAGGLGNRAVCTAVFLDHPHTDRVVDPYVSGRTFNPLTRGSFWTKWMIRNKYRQNILIKVYEGYIGQALDAMVKRTYFLQSIAGPDDAGKVSIQGKDIIARIEERKSQAPAASPGKLFADITNVQTSVEATNAVLADYAASGTIRIGDEIMTYSSRATTTNGVTFTVTARGTDNTIAVTHVANEVVQQCLRYTAIRIDDAIKDLLATYGKVDLAYLDFANWTAEISSYNSSFLLTTLITEPTSVNLLVSEIQEQCLVNVWWDERLALIKLRSVRGIDVEPTLITAESNIIAGTFRLNEKPRERASQVWIFFDQQDYVKDPKSIKAYRQGVIISNLESEGSNLYGEASIRKIFARWLNSSTLANTTASKISVRYVDTPSTCEFKMDAKDRGFWVGDTIKISHHLDVDQYGVRKIRNWTIVSAEEVIPGELVHYSCEDTTLYGRISYVMATGAANYPGAASAPFKSCYVGNSLGLLSDGETCGRIN